MPLRRCFAISFGSLNLIVGDSDASPILKANPVLSLSIPFFGFRLDLLKKFLISFVCLSEQLNCGCK